MITLEKPKTNPQSNLGSRGDEWLYNHEHDLFVRVMKITPDFAESMLGQQTKNRNLSKATVERYIRSMNKGYWMLNGESIVFQDGKLIDGQHRLHACIKSQASFTTIVVELGERHTTAFDSLNQGKKRNLSDVLSASDHKYTTQLAAAISLVGKFDLDRRITGNGSASRIAISNSEINAYCEKYPEIEHMIPLVSRWRKSLPVRLSPLVALYYLLIRAQSFDKTMVHSFMDKVFDGVGLEKGCPTLVFRNAILRKLNEKTIMEPGWLIKGGIISWNHFLSGKKISYLRVERGMTIPNVLVHGIERATLNG